VTGPLAQRRQRPRRRITPNTNTSTTTMISTHNHVEMAASLVGPGAVRGDATAGHPSKQLGHGQATSRAGIDGRYTRAREDPNLPADLGWPGRVQLGPASRPRAGPVGPSRRATPSQPAQPPHPAPHVVDPAGSTDPTRPQRADRRVGEAQQGLP
jgi:hypothetical protein